MFLPVTFFIPVFAQTLTTGDLSGDVFDQSGALVPHASVTLRSDDKGTIQSGVSDSNGFYRIAFLPPGGYTETVSAVGFIDVQKSVRVFLGKVTSVDIVLKVAARDTVVEVTGEMPLPEERSSEISTTFNSTQIANVPNPGNDLTYTVQTAPGVVMNTQGGTGNFSTFGLPANSNSFNLDGMNDNDPSLLINNSGSTNLLLGNNEIQEVSIVNNGYSGRYGGFAGASVDYLTKSGSTNFHGNAQYWWNGRILNANNWFNNDVPPGTPPTPRPFVNANQYAASLGGPIKKNKVFFFVDYEALRFVLPSNSLVLIPSPQFESATVQNLLSTGHQASVPFYNQMFELWNKAPGVERAVAGNPQTVDSTGCNGFTGPQGLGTTVPCVLSFRSTANNLTHEYLLGARTDFNLGQNDKLFLRLHEDQGHQTTRADPISPLFNLQSDNPIYQGQVSETHVFNSRLVNSLVVAGLYGSFIFQQNDLLAATAALPTTVGLSDGSLSLLLGPFSPIGTRLSRYQAMDDLSIVRGSHSLMFGLNFNRFDLSAFNSEFNKTGIILPFTLGDFFAGGEGPFGDLLQQNFSDLGGKPLALYWLGVYGQDEWRATRHLTLTFSARLDHSSNPVCQNNCIARFTSDFDSLEHNASIPYNRAIEIGQRQTLPSLTRLSLQPRFGFAWAPSGLPDTVFSGGVGFFTDAFPAAIIAGDVSSNPPLLNSFTIFNNNLSPAEPSNLFKDAQASNKAFVSGFLNGGTLASISAETPFFVPNFTNTTRAKTASYVEWNLKFQHGFGIGGSLSLNYVGNHGIHIPAFFSNTNAFCPPTNPQGLACPNGFVGLPRFAPDQRFGTVSELRTVGVSNYNGLSISFRLRPERSLLLITNYNWSHALDEGSSLGQLAFNRMASGPQGGSLPGNYGNADYDTRHYFSASFVWDVPHMFGPAIMTKGWQFAGTIFARTGFPYSVFDSFTTSVLSQYNYGGVVYANFLGGSTSDCSSPKIPCLQEGSFSSPINQAFPAFGMQRRNQFYGPRFFDTSLSVIKEISIPAWEGAKCGFGAQFFNAFNHPNFNQPNADIAQEGSFGFITGTVNSPTTIYGSLLGGDASPRSIQLTLHLIF